MSCLWVLLFLARAAVASGATDVVTMTTGERLVGEIKKLEKDVLTFETTYSDSDFKIEWDQIVSIESDRQFLVETFGGKRLAGPLKAEPGKKTILGCAFFCAASPLPRIHFIGANARSILRTRLVTVGSRTSPPSESSICPARTRVAGHGDSSRSRRSAMEPIVSAPFFNVNVMRAARRESSAP